MEKITDKIAALPQDANYFSLEFFPPKTQIGFSNLQTRLERMSSALRPLFVTVTWGAGGSTSSRSLELAEICQRQVGLTTCLHLTCTNMKRKVVDEALQEAKALGIRNILALRGDPPRKEEYGIEEEGENRVLEKESNEDFVWAIDLVRYIRKVHGDHFCIGVAAYPEGHADESHPIDQDPLHDLPYLVDKTKAGADFLMTQLFYDLNAYLKFEKMLREHESGVFSKIPIIPGLMPIQSYEILKRTTKLAHAKLPQTILDSLEGVRGDDEAVKRIGVDILSDIVLGIKHSVPSTPRGFHFFTLNLEKSVSEVLDRCNLVPPSPPETAVTDSPIASPMLNGVNGFPQKIPKHRTLSTTSSTPATQLTTNPHRSSSPPAPTREATWDDYPNGRFGDARSPAFNPPLSYSSYPHALPFSLWGYPSTPSDISSLFISHLSTHQPSKLPWSESAALSPETSLIKHHLVALIRSKGFWTIASQPAVDGLPSTHSIHGWGPPGGFVFQKAFVEFFVADTAAFSEVKEKLDALAESGECSYYAVNGAGKFHTSDEPGGEGAAGSKKQVHVVTWGVFQGKEIATATMVEEVSFRTWGEEAFAIWGEWARWVAKAGTGGEEGRRSVEFLRGVREGGWLVNVVGHGFREGERLWEVLLE